MTTLEELAALVAQQGRVIDDLDQAVADLGAATAPAAPAAPAVAAKPNCPTLAVFVEQIVAPLYAAHPPAEGWCARWWDHPEAVRLEAMWRAWETLRLDPNMGMSKWLRDVADVQMSRLRDKAAGPFVACTPGNHLPAPALPCTPVA